MANEWFRLTSVPTPGPLDGTCAMGVERQFRDLTEAIAAAECMLEVTNHAFGMASHKILVCRRDNPTPEHVCKEGR